jgi:hypothetical protein
MRGEKRINDLKKVKLLFDLGFEAYQIAELERADRILHRLNGIWLSRFMTDREKATKKRLERQTSEMIRANRVNPAIAIEFDIDPRSGHGFKINSNGRDIYI